MLDRLHGSLEREQRFLDEASHELRTPLGVLRMELDLALERARTPEELQAALRNASSETDRLVRLAEDLLVLSRTRDGSVPLHRQDVSVCELLEGTAAARSRTGGRTVRVRCEHGLVARLDPDRIRQAVDNLVDNALRHGGDAASVTMSASRAGDTLRISVSDSGPGFSPEVMARGDRGFARDGDGPDGDRTGLGLAIVAAIARSHGGRLVLANANGGGAAVATLDLPMS
jgi:signal transduction histidine kinase